MWRDLLQLKLWVVLSGVSVLVNFAIGANTDPFFIIIPVAIMAWFGGRAWGISMAVTMTLIHSWFHFEVWEENLPIFVRLGNSLLTLSVLGVFAEMTYRVASGGRTQARLLEEKEKLIRSLSEARENIKVLSGLLPICASCKKIRDTEGYWEQLEQYIHDHSEADFSHGICPDCMKSLYPEYAKDLE